MIFRHIFKAYSLIEGETDMDFVTLNNGLKMPILGYGVYQVSPEECVRCVRDALEVGYRSIDTAQAYNNETEVGQGILDSGVPREDIFLTTKIWVSNYGYEKAKASIDESLKKLKTEYVDLFLLHQPFGDYYGAYRALEDAYREGKVKTIGISNFYPDRYVDLQHFVDIAPMVNQLETHVFHQQKIAQEYMKKYNTQIESWGPFAEGKNGFFSNTLLQNIGDKYGKSIAQVALRFLIQSGVVVIPKTIKKERMIQNLNVFDFTLNVVDMKAIQSLDTGESLFFSHSDPATVEWFMSIIK